MKTRMLCAVVCAGLVAAPTVHSGPVNFDPGGAGPDAPASLPAAVRGTCGSDTLTQSTNPNVIGAATIICGDAEVSAEFSLARVFTVPYTMSVECVTFGVRLNDGPEWPARVRILLGPINGPYDSLTLLSETSVLIPADTAFEFFTVPMPDVVLPAGSEFIVELRSESRLPADGGDDGLLGFGCNVQGQTAPTYYRGPACAQPDFINLADIGFPGRHLVMTVGVEAVVPPANDGPLDATPVSMGSVASFTTVGAGSDGPGASCANAGDVWFTLQAGASDTLSVGLLAHDGADMAIALYDIGPTGVFMPDQLDALLVSCVDGPDSGEESATFDVTPGNFYLVQIGNGANGILPGTGDIGFSDGGGFTPFELPVLACVPCAGCVSIPFRDYFALTSQGATLISNCSECVPSPCPPCLNDLSHMIAYWPMDEISIPSPYLTTPDRIGGLDLLLPCTFAGPPGCHPNYTQVTGVRGGAMAFDANAFNGANSLPFSTPGALPDVGKGRFTLAAWIRVPANVTSTVFNAPGFPTGWSVEIVPTGSTAKIQLTMTSAACGSNPATSVVLSSAAVVPTGVWAHIVVVVGKQTTGSGCPSGGSAGFYVNGAPAGAGSLAGLSYDCSAIQYFVGGPNVWMDEVMLFDATLTTAKVQDLYSKSVTGPCEVSAWQTPRVDCNAAAPQATLVICNVFGPDQSFNVMVTPASVPLITSPTATPSPVFIPSGECATVQLGFTIPPGLTNTSGTMWQTKITDAGGSQTFLFGTVICQYLTIGGGGGGGGFLGLRVNDGPQPFTLDLTNVSGAPLMATYSLGVTNPAGDSDTSIFSLNGLAPGQATTGILNLPAGATAQVPITLEALSVDVLGWYELGLGVDIAGGSNFEFSGALGLQALPALPIAPCPGDTNGDGVIDFADLNTLLSSFNTAPPSPNYNPGADFDNDGDVDFADLNVLLSAFNTNC